MYKKKSLKALAAAPLRMHFFDVRPYIEGPNDLVDGRLGDDEALEVDIVPLLDAGSVQGLPQVDSNHRGI